MHEEMKAVLDAMKAARGAGPMSDEVLKAAGITTALGLLNYDLQRPALALYPWMASLTPLRNELPRTKGNGDVATRWKAITAINTGNVPLGVAEGRRNTAIETTLATYTASYQGIGLEDFVTFEADYGAEGYDDAKARAVQGTLRATMLAEEPMLLGGNVSVALGTTPTPTATGVATAGGLSDGTYKVGCVALTFDGARRATVGAAGAVQTIVRTNQDGTQDTINGGTAAPSALSSNVVLNAGTAVQRITANVTAVRGAVAYAWYVGTAGNEKIVAITYINSVNITALPAGGNQTWASLAATDYSQQTGFAFDGLLYQTAFKSTSGAYYTALATGVDGTGTKLTSDSAGGITQINTALAAFYDSWKTGPDEIWASAQHVIDMTSLVIAGGAAPLFRFELSGTAVQGVTGGGAVLKSYLNKVTGQMMAVRVHPNLPNGTIVFRTKNNPFPMSGVSNCDEVRCRRDYYQIEWPLRTRRYEYGVYADEVYVNYIPFLFGAITNVATGV